MSNEYIILLVLLALSYIGHNMSVFYAVGVILILKVFQLDALMQFVETNGLNYGIILLTIAILIPLATGKITVQMMIHSFYLSCWYIGLISRCICCCCWWLWCLFIEGLSRYCIISYHWYNDWCIFL